MTQVLGYDQIPAMQHYLALLVGLILSFTVILYPPTTCLLTCECQIQGWVRINTPECLQSQDEHSTETIQH